MSRSLRMSTAVRSFPAALVTAGLLGCSAELVVPRDEEPVASPALAHGAGNFIRTIDDVYADLADSIPGFGGMFYDAEGVLNVYLKEPATLAQARGGMQRFMERRAGASATRRSLVAAEVAGMRARQGRYDFRQLLDWNRGIVLPALGQRKDWSLLDIDDRRNLILVGVPTMEQVALMQRVLADLPLPPEAWDVDVFEGASAESGAAGVMTSAAAWQGTPQLTGMLRPVPAGARVQVPFGFSGADNCTLGYNLVAWFGTSISSERYLVTNAHCHLNHQGVGNVNGHGIGQPLVNPPVGVEVADPPFFTSSQHPDCPGNHCRFSDAAVYRYHNSATPFHGKVALPPLGGGLGIQGYATIIGVWAPDVGMTVQKVGATTGRTVGNVTHVCAVMPLMQGKSQTGIDFICQGKASYHSDDGDSGSPVIALIGDGTEAYAVGLHWRGNGGFSPVYAVINEMYAAYPPLGLLDPVYVPGGSQPAPAPPSLAVSIDGPLSVGPFNYACGQWTAVVQGGQGTLAYLWTGLFTGDQLTVTGTVPTTGGDLYVEVTDQNGNYGVNWITIQYDPNNTDQCQ